MSNKTDKKDFKTINARNFIHDVTKQIKTKNMISELTEMRQRSKHQFIYNSVAKYTGKSDMTLKEAQEFVKDKTNEVSFTSVNSEDLCEEWLLTINGTEYKSKFKLKRKGESE